MEEQERASEERVTAMEETHNPIEPAFLTVNPDPKHTDQGSEQEPSEAPDPELSEPSMDALSPEGCTSILTTVKPAEQSHAQEFIILDQNGQPLQCERMVIVTSQSENREVFVIPSSQLGGAQLLLPRGQILDAVDSSGSGGERSPEELNTITVTALSDDGGSLAAMTPAARTSPTKTSSQSSQDCFVAPMTPLPMTPLPMTPLPSNAPNWAQRLRSAEKIGDSYRGFCTTDSELETILLLHKQQTTAVFGTRQSPSPAKPATRLMWKSQYVPYDGIPFVNAGSRAIVMECQYGPRRKGLAPRKVCEGIIQNIDYKATCPARIYIKKVRKFPQYRVPTDPKVDKKVVRQEQEKAFFNLRKTLDGGGVLRYYMQLPTQKAHLYHDMDTPLLPPPPDLFAPIEEDLMNEEPEEEGEGTDEVDGGEGGLTEDGGSMPSRLHPLVADKIRELVSQGHHQVYTVRKQLRRFVEREMFRSEEVPERHNLCYFPTVNDLKNHIHEAQKGLQQAGVVTQWGALCGDPLTETVTLTLTPATTEVTLQGGVFEGTDTLSAEAVQLFSSLTSLQPKIFAQLQGVQLQPVPTLCSFDGHLPQTNHTTDSLELTAPSPPQSLLVSPTQFLQSSPLGEGVALAEPSAVLGVGQMVSVSAIGGGGAEGGGTHQILLEDGQTIPVQIVDHSTIGLDSSEDQEEVKEEVKEEVQNVTVNPGD